MDLSDAIETRVFLARSLVLLIWACDPGGGGLGAGGDEVEDGGTRSDIVMRTQDRRGIKQTLPLLQVLKELRPSRRGVVLNALCNRRCESIVEGVRHILQCRKYSCSDRLKIRRVLLPHKKHLRYLCDRSVPVTKRRARLRHLPAQTLDAILGIAIPCLLHIVEHVR